MAHRSEITALVAFGLLAVCAQSVAAGDARLAITPTHVRLIRAPKGTAYVGALWWNKGRMVVTDFVTGISPWKAHIASVSLSTGRRTELALHTDAGCPLEGTTNSDVLQDGRIVYVHGCYGNPARVPARVSTMWVYDPKTNRNASFRPYSLPIFGIQYDVSKDGETIASDGNQLEEQLEWLRPTKPVHFHLPFQRVLHPVWDPTGSVFVTAVATGHAKGVDRLNLPESLCFINRREHVVRTLFSGLQHVSAASWSHDGKWLAVVMQPQGEPDGLWLVRLRDGRAFLVMEGKQFGDASWLPGDRRLVASDGVYSYLPDAKRFYGTSPVGIEVIDLPRLPG